MKRALSIGLIAITLIISSFVVSALLSPQLSRGLDGIGGQLEVKEIVWDGGILNGEYQVTIANPTDKIIEASIYVYAQNKFELWEFLKCGQMITVFYPNSEIEIHTEENDYLFSESLKIIALSGDSYIFERVVQVTKFIQFEFVSVEWGEMVNRSYESENARWLNFTLFNNGDALTPSKQFSIGGDSRGWNTQQGLTSILMMGDTRISDYQLYYDGKLIWESNIQ